MILILAVTKVRISSLDRAVVCEVYKGRGVLVNIAFVWLLLVK